MKSEKHRGTDPEDWGDECDRKNRQRLLGEMLDGLDARHGPVDEILIAKYVDLLATESA